ncbi:MAG: site-2 protease family protein [Myxococcales bacterium]|nr:site-2 protease family protein [Myxococcales bacterium]
MSVEPFARAQQAAAPDDLAVPHRKSRRIAGVLFAITLVSTTLAGALMAGEDPFASLAAWAAGLTFSLTLLTILLGHELGHYLTSRRYGVDTSPPYFIPVPPPLSLIGTFGAFIRMRSPVRTRRALFDIAVAGPWVGFILSIPAIWFGLQWSTVTPRSALADGIHLQLGDNLFFWAMQHWLLNVPEGAEVVLHPVAFAGWLGLFVTSLNLLPIGQLDGGHVSYALFGDGHAKVARAMVVALIVLGVFSSWKGWIFWAVIVSMLGLRHPPTLDPTPIDPIRRRVGWLTLALFVVAFTPAPFVIRGLVEQI